MSKTRFLAPMHLTEVQRKMEVARIYNQQVDIWLWEKSTADIIRLKDWQVLSGHWRGGSHNMKNMVSGAVRNIRDVNIFRFNGHEVYI